LYCAMSPHTGIRIGVDEDGRRNDDGSFPKRLEKARERAAAVMSGEAKVIEAKVLEPEARPERRRV
jgi:hypothetical protein